MIDKTLAANLHIRMISERCDTEDWNNAWNDYVQVLFALFQFFINYYYFFIRLLFSS